MQNDKFWNEKLQKRVVDYIKSDAFFSQFKAVDSNQLEESLVKLLKAFKEDVYREVEREYHREDVISKVEEHFSEKEAKFLSGLPICLINFIVDDWQSIVEDSDSFWEAYWDPLMGILSETSYLGGLENYNDEEIQLYKNYLIDWFQNHNEGAPACIGEFFDCEMQDTENKSEEYDKNG